MSDDARHFALRINLPSRVGPTPSSALFHRVAINIVANDTNGVYDGVVREIASQASSSSFGAGFPRTEGTVPTFDLLAPPVLGHSTALSIETSSCTATQGSLSSRVAAADSPTTALGTQFVAAPSIVLLATGSNGATFGLTVPADTSLAGLEIFFQAIEFDPGATPGVAFMAGLVIHPSD